MKKDFLSKYRITGSIFLSVISIIGIVGTYFSLESMTMDNLKLCLTVILFGLLVCAVLHVIDNVLTVLLVYLNKRLLKEQVRRIKFNILDYVAEYTDEKDWESVELCKIFNNAIKDIHHFSYIKDEGTSSYDVKFILKTLLVDLQTDVKTRVRYSYMSSDSINRWLIKLNDIFNDLNKEQEFILRGVKR